MQEKIVYKPYKKSFDYSYTLGAFPTLELIKAKKEIVRCIYVHSKYDGSVDIEKICKVFNIELNYFCKKGKSFNNLFKKVLKIYLIINAVKIVLALIGLLIFKIVYERNIF